MKKKLFISLLIVSLLCVFVGCKSEQALSTQEVAAEKDADFQSAEASESYVVINEETYAEKVDVTLPARSAYDSDDAYAEAVKAEALELFKIANANDQNCLRRLALTQNLVSTVGVDAKNLVVDLKNGEEYLKYDFQPDVKKFGITVDGHAKATYARLGLAKAYYVEIGDSKIDADWNGTASFGDTEGELTVDTARLCFHASQKQAYCVTEAVVNLKTIRSATLTHNDEEGYYTIVFDLDPTSTGAARYLLPSLRKNSGMNNAKYTSITETIEIWDNGFFKRFLSVDKWSSSVITSTINFDTAYYYDADSCDMTKYNANYYATIKVKAATANAEAAANATRDYFTMAEDVLEKQINSGVSIYANGTFTTTVDIAMLLERATNLVPKLVYRVEDNGGVEEYCPSPNDEEGYYVFVRFADPALNYPVTSSSLVDNAKRKFFVDAVFYISDNTRYGVFRDSTDVSIVK